MLALPQWPTLQVPPTEARLFVGLWPSADTVKRLRVETASLMPRLEAQGRALKPPHWHITLAFLGSTTKWQWQQLLHGLQEQALTAAKVVPSILFLDRLGVFAKAEVLWLGIDPNSSEYAQLQQVQQQLWQYLKPLGWQVEDRDFVPHVSLLRKAKPSDIALPVIKPIIWHNATLKLIVSMPNNERSEYYQVLDINIIL